MARRFCWPPLKVFTGCSMIAQAELEEQPLDAGLVVPGVQFGHAFRWRGAGRPRRPVLRGERARTRGWRCVDGIVAVQHLVHQAVRPRSWLTLLVQVAHADALVEGDDAQSGVSSPAMHFSRVLLPVPLRATMAVFWPFSSPKETCLGRVGEGRSACLMRSTESTFMRGAKVLWGVRGAQGDLSGWSVVRCRGVNGVAPKFQANPGSGRSTLTSDNGQPPHSPNNFRMSPMARSTSSGLVPS
jgi:hypothetical protein